MAEKGNAIAEINVKVYGEGAYLTISGASGNASEYALSTSATNYLCAIINQNLDESLCLAGPEIRLLTYKSKNK
jgi:hypothetical protein